MNPLYIIIPSVLCFVMGLVVGASIGKWYVKQNPEELNN